jgi:AraC family transcriptional regulator
MNDITIVTVKPQWVLGIRKMGKYEQIPPMIMVICQYAGEHGIPLVGPPVFVMHEMSAEEAVKANEAGTADIEVAMPVGGEGKGEGDVKSYQLPGGKMATLIHKGPYQECGPTYERLFAWLQKREKRITGPIREVYLNDPREVSEKETLTQIYAPVE